MLLAQSRRRLFFLAQVKCLLAYDPSWTKQTHIAEITGGYSSKHTYFTDCSLSFLLSRAGAGFTQQSPVYCTNMV